MQLNCIITGVAYSLFLFSLHVNFQVLLGGGYGIVFQSPFHIFMLLDNFWFILLRGDFSILRTRTCPDLYQLICPPRKPFALDRGIKLIPEFIHSPRTLAFFDLPTLSRLEVLVVIFSFNKDETWKRFSYFAKSFKEWHSLPQVKCKNKNYLHSEENIS